MLPLRIILSTGDSMHPSLLALIQFCESDQLNDLKTLEHLIIQALNFNNNALNQKNDKFITCLFYACSNAHITPKNIRLLLQYGADPNITQGKWESKSLLSVACENKKATVEVIHTLLNYGSYPTYDRYLKDALITANNEIAKELIQRSPLISLTSNVLYEVCKQQPPNLELIQCLLEKPIDPNQTLSWGPTILNTLCKAKIIDLKVIALLLKYGADINLGDNNVNYLIEGGHFELAQLLLSMGAKPPGSGKLLIILAESKTINLTLFNQLIEAGENSNPLKGGKNLLFTTLEHATHPLSLSIFALLRGVVDLKRAYCQVNSSPLQRFICELIKRTDSEREHLLHSLSTNLLANFSWKTHFKTFLAVNKTRVITSLLAFHRYKKEKGPVGPPKFLQFEIIKQIVINDSLTAVLSTITSEELNKIITNTLQNTYSNFLRAFNEYEFNKTDIMKNLDLVNTRDEDHNTLFHQASKTYVGDNVFELLLKKGASPNAQNKYGTTPLHIFCQQYSGEYSRIEDLTDFLNYGANPALQDYTGKNSLFYACQHQKIEIDVIDLLLTRAFPNSRDHNDNTPMHEVCKQINLDEKLLNDLLIRKFDPCLTNKQGHNALDVLIDEGNADHKLVKRLLNAGCLPTKVIDALSCFQKDPVTITLLLDKKLTQYLAQLQELFFWLLCQEKMYFESLELLIKNGVSLALKDPETQKLPLELALANTNYLQLSLYLLLKGANSTSIMANTPSSPINLLIKTLQNSNENQQNNLCVKIKTLLEANFNLRQHHEFLPEISKERILYTNLSFQRLRKNKTFFAPSYIYNQISTEGITETDRVLAVLTSITPYYANFILLKALQEQPSNKRKRELFDQNTPSKCLYQESDFLEMHNLKPPH